MDFQEASALYTRGLGLIKTALILAAVLLPLHRDAYQLDLRSLGPVLLMLGKEILIGLMLGMTAR